MRQLIEFALRSRTLMVVLAALVFGGGYYSFTELPVDAFPDVTPALVQVFTETEGLAPEEVERYVTFPVEVSINGLPHLQQIRSVSNFGLSVINVYFDEGTDVYFARQLVNERLQLAREQIPAGFGEPEMGPIATGLGQILFYVVEDSSQSYTPEQLRRIQDWQIKFNLQTVPGVTEVLSLGGHVRQFQVLVRPEALLRFDLKLADLVRAVRENNANTGAQFIVKNSERYVVRSVGLAERLEDLQDIVVKAVDGRPVYLSQVADVVIGGELRHGLVTMDGKGETVAGMVLKLIGTNTSQVIEATKARVQAINESLPAGIRVVPYYDQASLVARCVATVTQALQAGVVLVVVVLLVFLGGLRPSVVVALSIPFSILFAFILMKLLGMSANLMSLGGLAIAIGMLVDGAVVMTENVHARLQAADEQCNRVEVVTQACIEVGRPILFAILIIIAVFLPLFTLQGVEGKTFRPLAQTVALAMVGSLLYSVFLAPVMASLLMRRAVGTGGETAIVRALRRVHGPLVAAFVRSKRLTLGAFVLVLLLGAVVFPRLGSEFVPRLNEGDLLVRITMAPSIDLDAAGDMVTTFEQRLMARFPEVERVVSRVGRGEVGAHADPVNNAESFLALKPQDQWTTAATPDELYGSMAAAFEDFPGARFNFTQPIAAAVDELLTGTKAELAIKLFGPDMDELKHLSEKIEQVVSQVPGAADVQRDQVTGTPQLLIQVDRKAIARYGINVGDVQQIIHTAVGGEKAGQIFEGIPRFDIVVRFVEESRNRADAIGRILVPAPDGSQVQLRELASIEEIVGPRQITREDGQRFITVQCNVRGRDMGSFVAQARRAIAEQVQLPPGYLVSWGGQFELQQRANERLAWIVPLTVGLVFVMLYSAFGSARHAVLVLLNVPFALVGGVVSLYLSGHNLSVPSSVGFIALFGVAVLNGVVLVSYLNGLIEAGRSPLEAALQGAESRLRPVLMTALTTALGLLPLLLTDAAGSEVQKPLAIVVIGGLATSTVLTLLVLPSLYRWFGVRRVTQGAG